MTEPLPLGEVTRDRLPATVAGVRADGMTIPELPRDFLNFLSHTRRSR